MKTLAQLTLLSALISSSPQCTFAAEFDEDIPVNATKEMEPPPTIRMTIESDEKKFSPKSQSDTKSKSGVAGKIAGMTSFPKSAAGVVCGVAVGVPVQMGKSMNFHTKRMRAQVSDDVSGDKKPDLTSKLMSNALAVPYGVTSGFILGIIRGTERGVECGHRKPFSKESMSINDPD
ncbi:MAG: hypothetical protein IAF58_18985 [Leptolyngbya sp.]|nr:hypothetical protein [Candidatus Melainabacteria bacterium]